MQTRNLAAGLVAMGVVALVSPLQAQSFDPLFRIAGIRGACQVKTPDATSFESATKGKAYPFGTAIRTGKDSEAQILFSADDVLRMSASSELTITEPDGVAFASSRIVRLAEGRVDFVVRDGLSEKALVVDSAVATCDSLSGRGSVELQKGAKRGKDKLELSLLARVDNGSLRVRGPQFSVPKLKSGSAVRINSSGDRSVTRIDNEAGDYQVAIENGTDTPVSVLDTSLHGSISIRREEAAAGSKKAVSVLEIAPDAKPKNSFSFVVGDLSLGASILPVLPECRMVATVPPPAVTTNAPAAALPTGVAPAETQTAGDTAKKEEAKK